MNTESEDLDQKIKDCIVGLAGILKNDFSSP